MRSLLVALGACTEQPPDERVPDPCEAPGTICTWMGSPGVAMFSPEGVHRTEAALYFPEDIVFSPEGEAFVPDFNNHRVRKVDPAGMVTTVAGTGVPGDGPEQGDCDGGCPARLAHLWHPAQVALDPSRPGVLAIAAWHNHRIVELNLATGELTWTVGTGSPGYGPKQLAYPSSLAYGPDGTLYISDQANYLVRAVVGGALTDVAGTPGLAGYAGDGGPAIEATLHGHADWTGGPTSKLEVANGRILLADTVNGMIRAIDLQTGTIERVAGRFVPGADTGSLPSWSGDGGPALDAGFSYPRDATVGPDGALYVADTGNHCIRRVNADGIVEVFAGRCGENGMAGDEGPATEALMDFPSAVSFDAEGHLYVADANNHVIRRIAR